METQDSASWADKVLTYTAHYDWPHPHSETFTLTRVELDQPADYWAAADGQCFGVRASGAQTCIATVESALKCAGARGTYVIWRPKTVTPSVIRRWVKTWSGRTQSGGEQ